MASDLLDHFHCTDEQAPAMLTSAFARETSVVKLSAAAVEANERRLFNVTARTREITFIPVTREIISRVGKRKAEEASRELLVIAPVGQLSLSGTNPLGPIVADT